MSSLKINLPYLEQLSTRELSSLAKSFDIEIPPGRDRTRIIGELLEFAPCLNFYQQGSGKGRVPSAHFAMTEPPRRVSKTLPELPPPVPLPKQYGFSYIDVLIRDPFWIYVFWGICTADRKKYEQKPAFGGYTLRVLLDNCLMEGGNEAVLSTGIDVRDHSRYLNIPSEIGNWKHCPQDSTCPYIVELCARSGEEDVALVSSHSFHLPRTLPLPGRAGSEILDKPMLKLSGISDLDVYRNAEGAPLA
ncbi:MAG: DUF4912 domain-containing protein [Spirochaetaceae bacterium]|jgi:hypothetical protein|nr:DUF4912 domain-containing protein [Spirochaetaceae bacterium]